MRNTNQAGIELIKHYEGCQLWAYLCPALKWSIGYGSTHDVVPGMIIDQTEAEERLRRDLWTAEKVVADLVGGYLTDNEFSSLVSLVYNIGSGNFAKSSLLHMLNNKQHDRVPQEFLRWDHCGGKVLKGLHLRRVAEAELFQRL